MSSRADTPAGSDFIDIAGGGAYSLALIPEPFMLFPLGPGAVGLRKSQKV